MYEKLSKVLSVAGFRFVREIKPPTPVLPTVHFPIALKALVLGNLFKLAFQTSVTSDSYGKFATWG